MPAALGRLPRPIGTLDDPGRLRRRAVACMARLSSEEKQPHRSWNVPFFFADSCLPHLPDYGQSDRTLVKTTPILSELTGQR